MKQKKKGALRTVVVVAAMTIAFLFYAMATWQDAGLPPAGEVIGNALAQDEAGEDAPTRMIDWEALLPEVVAWVEVPGTRIDEPIAQAVEGAPNAFLYRDALGGQRLWNAIYRLGVRRRLPIRDGLRAPHERRVGFRRHSATVCVRDLLIPDIELKNGCIRAMPLTHAF